MTKLNKTLSAVALCLSLLSCRVQAQEPDPYLDYAKQGQIADVVSTAIAIGANGATEVNPLQAGVIPLKIALLYSFNKIEDPIQRKNSLKILGTLGWAPVLGNLIGVSTAGAAVGLAAISALIIHNSVDLEEKIQYPKVESSEGE